MLIQLRVVHFNVSRVRRDVGTGVNARPEVNCARYGNRKYTDLVIFFDQLPNYPTVIGDESFADENGRTTSGCRLNSQDDTAYTN